MNIIQILTSMFSKKHSISAPLLIIRKSADESNLKEYNSIEEAINDLENDPNVSPDKIEKLKSSLKNLKSKTSIKIRDGEIIN